MQSRRDWVRAVTMASWLGLLLGIAVISFLPVSADQLPQGSRSWFGFGHILAYGLHAVLLLQLLLTGRRSMFYLPAVSIAAAATLLLSGVIELLQPIVGRSRDLTDFALNALGIAMALGLLSLLRGGGMARGS